MEDHQNDTVSNLQDIDESISDEELSLSLCDLPIDDHEEEERIPSPRQPFRLRHSPSTDGKCRCRPISGNHRKQKVLIGLVRFQPELEMTKIKERRSRRIPAKMFPATDGGEVTVAGDVNVEGVTQWGLKSFRCRSHFLRELTKASFRCRQHVVPKLRLGSELKSKMDSKPNSKPNLKLKPKLKLKPESKLVQARIEVKLKPKIDSKPKLVL
ncbi:hypothetical protein FEM48_Zijuj03G0086800 [Ziziphus jujuba var. spinosa]|uniref:Uncharacterized protein n=1 Tax=Ziziphus jujuba var. spinosa TaxID=714518 RepID=A0A978VPA9_ZIZJJ|nr:hypothetical protein FEM48_Zijuj03G0086800 [Ziziphus jujuba var. spinosa]